MMRLNKFLAKAGVFARRKCDKYIMSGMVYVNSKKITNPGYKIDEVNDEVILFNKRIVLKDKYKYIILNKPKGCVTTLKDEKGRKRVVDYVKISERIFPVGRLDIDTTGVLLLTNDGDLSYRLSHPKYEVDKVYYASIDSQISEEDIGKLIKGVKIGEEEIVSGEVKVIENDNEKCVVSIKIHTGKKRQVRRMFDALGYKVIELDRVEFAGIVKKDIKPGEWRTLYKNEVDNLKKMVN